MVSHFPRTVVSVGRDPGKDAARHARINLDSDLGRREARDRPRQILEESSHRLRRRAASSDDLDQRVQGIRCGKDAEQLAVGFRDDRAADLSFGHR